MLGHIHRQTATQKHASSLSIILPVNQVCLAAASVIRPLFDKHEKSTKREKGCTQFVYVFFFYVLFQLSSMFLIGKWTSGELCDGRVSVGPLKFLVLGKSGLFGGLFRVFYDKFADLIVFKAIFGSRKELEGHSNTT